MRHPLATKSLAPYGFVFPRYVERLAFEPKPEYGGFNAERVIAKQWERAHRVDAPEPTPLEVIIHRILPGMGTLTGRFKPDFEFKGRPYNSRDIALVSTTVQWLGTNIGNSFLLDAYRSKEAHPERVFSLLFKRESHDMVMHFTHICSEKCKDGHTGTVLPFNSCWHDPEETTLRDRVAVDALMWWLGRKAGRAFIEEHFARSERAGKAARERADAYNKETLKIA